MAFSATLSTQDGTATIALEGDLDAGNAPIFQQNVDQAAEHDPTRLVLEMSKLQYISSAGLRQLVYARQKLADDVRMVLVSANQRVKDTIRRIDFDQSVTFTDTLPD